MMNMDNKLIGILVFAVALVTSFWFFPRALKFSWRHDILDAPDVRKLQRRPVPVFGGIVVFSGILAGMIVLQLFIPSDILMWGVVAMSVMLVIGFCDDVRGLPAFTRLIVEILLIGGFIYFSGIFIDDFHGLWGIHDIPKEIGVPLSIFVGVGLVNAINMIDGVDGYSSGYVMMACFCLAGVFWSVWDIKMVCVALILIGAIIPFFLHNVFGERSRMFIGDSGTMMLGMLLVVMAFYSLSSTSSLERLEDDGICVIAFLIAVGSIPVFDTLRVMTVRMVRGKSPFKADMTHLHHLFIDMKFSHLGASLAILATNAVIVLAWLLSWKLGASFEMQLYVVICLGILVTFVFYHLMRLQQFGGELDEEGYPQGTKLWKLMCRFGEWTHKEDKRSWRLMKVFMDGPMLGRGLWLLLCLVLCACEKHIEIDYHNAVPRYALEGWLTHNETIVHVCLTREMSDTTNVSNISNAIVTLTDDDGHVKTIPYNPEMVNGGYYTLDFGGEVGHTYRLDVAVDDQHFSSTSTMYSTPVLWDFRVVYRTMMSERYLFGDVQIQDIPNEVNYYYIHVFRNGIPYRSAVIKDDTNPGGILQQLFAFNRVGSTDWDVLCEGDTLSVEVRTIDERSYNYLYAVIQMDNTGTNPPDNFTGGCLGYFSAFSNVSFGMIFHIDNVIEDE